MKNILIIFLLILLNSCTIVSPNTGLGVAVQPIPVTTSVVYLPNSFIHRNYWWVHNRHNYNNFYRPTVRINLNPPRRHWNGPRGGRRN
jgi:hypothetical protein